MRKFVDIEALQYEELEKEQQIEINGGTAIMQQLKELYPPNPTGMVVVNRPPLPDLRP